jgi:glycerol-3-phosphate O-acyltransferase
MIFRQMFDSTSGTYSYLLASRRGGEALIIDPVLEKVDRYLQLLREPPISMPITSLGSEPSETGRIASRSWGSRVASMSSPCE